MMKRPVVFVVVPLLFFCIGTFTLPAFAASVSFLEAKFLSCRSHHVAMEVSVEPCKEIYKYDYSYTHNGKKFEFQTGVSYCRNYQFSIILPNNLEPGQMRLQVRVYDEWGPVGTAEIGGLNDDTGFHDFAYYPKD